MAGTEDAPLGLMAALPDEAQGLFDEMARDRACTVETVGARAYHRGKLWGRPCVISLAGIGKVAAATTATAMIHRYGVGSLLFTGVAGGLGQGVAIGDVVLADTLLQHDLDARPLFPRYEVPGKGRSRFPADAAMTDRLPEAVSASLPLAPRPARLHRGLVISGDRFVNGVEAVRQLRRDL